MKKRNIHRYRLIVQLVAIALCAFCMFQSQALAQVGYVVIFPSVGLAQEQSLRLTLFNPSGDPVRVRTSLHTSGGVLVGMGDGSVRSGAFGSFEFKRSDIPIPGDRSAGGLQLRASCYISMAETLKQVERLVVSMETVSISDGTSNTIFFGEVIPQAPSSGERDANLGSGAGDFLMTIARGKTLRVNIFNPSIEFEPLSSQINGHVKVFDRSGSPIMQSDEMIIPPGAIRSFDLNGDAFTHANSTQARISPFFDFKAERLNRVLVSLEIIDNATGKTELLAGNQCLVFYLGGVPGN